MNRTNNAPFNRGVSASEQTGGGAAKGLVETPASHSGDAADSPWFRNNKPASAPNVRSVQSFDLMQFAASMDSDNTASASGVALTGDDSPTKNLAREAREAGLDAVMIQSAMAYDSHHERMM